jgi:hypothetical protein
MLDYWLKYTNQIRDGQAILSGSYVQKTLNETPQKANF